ncbi:MAG: hypothetical protein KC496_14855 [Anaerolineae bacterium]|nr:hypothetical protein [Anaerolineae bacterium]
MARRSKGKFGLRGFIILVIVTAISGFALKATGNLTSPFEYSVLMLNTPAIADDGGFQMVQLDDASSDASTSEDSGFAMIDLDDIATTDESTSDTTATDEAAVTAEGIDTAGEMPAMTYTLADYFAFSWDDFGTVLYNLWFMALLTIVVIIVARPVGWLIKRYKQTTRRRTHNLAA